MILQGNQRGGAKQLAQHLLNATDNEHVEVLAVEGFCSDELQPALQEVYAISKNTHCKKFMFSVVMSPPEGALLPDKIIQQEAQKALQTVGLQNQPHVLVAHEKQGRKHYHLIASRIDTQHMKAIELGLYKNKLNELSRSLYKKHGWELPEGFKDGQVADPRNFNLAEWQKAKRLGLHPKQLKGEIKQCWDQTDSRQSFETALREQGCYLAQGDRRGFVAISWQGEIIPLNKRNLGAVAKDIRAKLGDTDSAPAVKTIQAKIALENYDHHKNLRRELAVKQKSERRPLATQKRQIVKFQQQERKALILKHEKRALQENQQRLNRLRHGWRGLWDFVTGQSAKTKARNATEARQCAKRDAREKQQLNKEHLQERLALQKQLNGLREKHQQQTIQLNATFVKNMDGLMHKGELQNRFNHMTQHIDAPKRHHLPEQHL